MLESPAGMARELARSVEDLLGSVGVLGRVFARAKLQRSFREKLARYPNKYSRPSKLVQDPIGIRIGLYFADDIDVVRDVCLEHFERGEVVQDQPGANVFGPTRLNIVFTLPERYRGILQEDYASDLVDDTFELQIRTIVSEGWHEVEHDLRYKNRSDWTNDPVLDRALNGLYATLETCDWGMLRIFEDLAYGAYRRGQWSAMMRAKFRLRFTTGELGTSIKAALDRDPEAAKALYRSDRNRFIRDLASWRLMVPLSMDLAVGLLNFTQIHSRNLPSIDPRNPVQLLARSLQLAGSGKEQLDAPEGT